MNDYFCLTCGFSWDDRENEDYNDAEHARFDSAHHPNWSGEPSEERSIMESLIDGTWS